MDQWTPWFSTSELLWCTWQPPIPYRPGSSATPHSQRQGEGTRWYPRWIVSSSTSCCRKGFVRTFGQGQCTWAGAFGVQGWQINCRIQRSWSRWWLCIISFPFDFESLGKSHTSVAQNEVCTVVWALPASPADWRKEKDSSAAPTAPSESFCKACTRSWSVDGNFVSWSSRSILPHCSRSSTWRGSFGWVYGIPCQEDEPSWRLPSSALWPFGGAICLKASGIQWPAATMPPSNPYQYTFLDAGADRCLAYHSWYPTRRLHGRPGVWVCLGMCSPEIRALHGPNWCDFSFCRPWPPAVVWLLSTIAHRKGFCRPDVDGWPGHLHHGEHTRTPGIADRVHSRTASRHLSLSLHATQFKQREDRADVDI